MDFTRGNHPAVKIAIRYCKTAVPAYLITGELPLGKCMRFFDFSGGKQFWADDQKVYAIIDRIFQEVK